MRCRVGIWLLVALLVFGAAGMSTGAELERDLNSRGRQPGRQPGRPVGRQPQPKPQGSPVQQQLPIQLPPAQPEEFRLSALGRGVLLSQMDEVRERGSRLLGTALQAQHQDEEQRRLLAAREAEAAAAAQRAAEEEQQADASVREQGALLADRTRSLIPARPQAQPAVDSAAPAEDGWGESAPASSGQPAADEASGGEEGGADAPLFKPWKPKNHSELKPPTQQEAKPALPETPAPQMAVDEPAAAADNPAGNSAEAPALPPVERPRLKPSTRRFGGAGSEIEVNAALDSAGPAAMNQNVAFAAPALSGPSAGSPRIALLLPGPGESPASRLRPPLELQLPSSRPGFANDGLSSKIKELERGNKKKKLVALTFDDGPHPLYTAQILATLDYYQVPATFFFVGQQSRKYPSWVKMAHQQGHEIANHTYDHFRLTRLPREEQEYQLDECSKVLSSLTGELPRFMRPPGGQIDGKVGQLVNQRGMITAMWDVALNDTSEGMTTGKLHDTALREIRPGSIVLAHDGIQATIDMLPGLITSLQEKGYRFVTMSQLASEL